MPPIHFNWDDMARAGDKIPESPDDKKCGDHYIPKWKDCHDGKAHDPDPGENPYWTDENSAEERRDRDVPWDTNKPKSREEREKETEWEEPEEEVAPEPEPEPEIEEETPEPEPEPELEEPEVEPEQEPDYAPYPGVEEREKILRDEEDRRRAEEEQEREGAELPWQERQRAFEKEQQSERERSAEDAYREGVRQEAVDKWAAVDEAYQQRRATQTPRELSPESLNAYKKKMRATLQLLDRQMDLAYSMNVPMPGSNAPTPGEQNEEWQFLRGSVASWADYKGRDQEDLDLMADAIRKMHSKVDIAVGDEFSIGKFQAMKTGMKGTEKLIDMYEEDKFFTVQPQDIQAWDRLTRNPEKMTSITEVPGFQIRTDGAHGVEQDMREAEALFANWQQEPGGLVASQLANLFMGDKLGPGVSLEPNYEVAKIMAERSAKYGSEESNDMLWKEFGMSEEWTPTSFVHDYRKAAQKATKMAKAELGLDIADFIKDNKSMAKLERAFKKAQKVRNANREEYYKTLRSLRQRRDSGQIDMDTYHNDFNTLDEWDQKTDVDFGQARDARNFALRDLEEKTEKARQDLRLNLAMANQQTLAEPYIRESISSTIDRPSWRSRDNDKPELTKSGKVTRKAKIAFDELMHARDVARKRNPNAAFTNAESLKESLDGVLGYLHKDLIEGAGILSSLSWENEDSFRAHADELHNAIRLDTNSTGEVAVHEFGHHIEFNNPNVKSRFLDFFNWKTEGVKAKRLARYEKWELFKVPTGKRAFYREYAGSFYMAGGRQSATELLSLGLQALESRSEFKKLMKGDPEHLAIVLATIRGY